MKFYSDSMRHLVCTPFSVANLHKMAEALGISRCWFHNGSHPHYDIPKRRLLEIASKTEVVSARRILEIVKGEL